MSDRLTVRRLWDNYAVRFFGGSVVLLGVLPFILRAMCVTTSYYEGAVTGTGVAIVWYTVETYYLRRYTWSANQAGLLKQILEEHAASAEDREVIRNWWRTDPATALARYAVELQRPEAATDLPLHESRRRVSQYFLRLRALCEEGMLEDRLVARTLGDEAVQVFVLYIDPLDETVRQVDGKGHKTAEREYFRGYLRRFFPETADQDPWGLR